MITRGNYAHAGLYCFGKNPVLIRSPLSIGILLHGTDLLHKVYGGRMEFIQHYPHDCGMGDEMPDVTQAEVGRRLYHVHREKRVEEAIKHIQQGLGMEWKSFSEDEIILFGHLLQCTWNTIDQKIWDKISFSSVTKSDVQKILAYGKGVGPGKNPEQAAVVEIKKILLAVK
jgi:hypothetical protein